MEAFAGESQANRRYLAFSEAAGKEGHKNVALLFKAAAEAETVHALNHFRAGDHVKNTVENLKAAIEGEKEEFTCMYPRMVADAEAEKHKKALTSFKYAMEIEKQHHAYFTEALKALEAGQDFHSGETLEFYICPVCGETHLGKVGADYKCPVCGCLGSRFKLVTY